MTPVTPAVPVCSLYSDQPTIPSSVVNLRKQARRNPASP
jgi:hypothetical protein